MIGALKGFDLRPDRRQQGSDMVELLALFRGYKNWKQMLGDRALDGCS